MVLTTPALFIVIFAPLAGALIDRIGRKRLLIAGVALYGVAGTFGFYIGSLWGILAGRAVIGVAIAIIFTATTALIADYYQGPARARFLGLQAGFMSTCGVLFHPIGGALADIKWNVTFLIYATAFLFVPLAIIFLYEPEFRSREQVASHNGRRLAQVVPVLLLAVVFGLTHIGQIIFYTISVQLPFYLQMLDIRSAGTIGLFTGFSSLMMGLAGLSYGWVKNRLSYPQIVSLCFGLISMGYLIIGLSGRFTTLLLGLFLAGTGLGLNNPNLVSWLVDQTPEDMRGRALGVRLTFNYLGQFLSPILFQPLIVAGGVPAAYVAAAGLGGAVMVVTLLVSGVRARSSSE